MSRAYLDYSSSQRDNMQEDTFSLIANQLFLIDIAYRQKNVQELHGLLDSMYLFVWNRLNKEENNEVETKLKGIANILYTKQDELSGDGGLLMSRLLDDCRTIIKMLTKALDRTGILFKIQTDLDELVKQGGA